MGCLPIPSIPTPSLPSPLGLPSLPAAAVPPGYDSQFCCKISIPLPTANEIASALGLPPLPPGPIVGLALLTTVLAALDSITKFLDSRPKFDCPLESVFLFLGTAFLFAMNCGVA